MNTYNKYYYQDNGGDDDDDDDDNDDDDKINTTVPRILFTRESHQTLLSAICNGTVFGFARAKVTSSPVLVDKALNPRTRFLFPPICRAIKLEPGHLSAHARERWCRAGRPALSDRAIVQTYHTDNQLLLSETLKYYIELGATVEIHEFFQYQAHKAFTPFCEKVIALRKRSKNEGNASMGTTAKLIGNSQA